MIPTLRVIYARSHSLGGLLIRHHDNVAPGRWSHSGAIVDTLGAAPFVVHSTAFEGVIKTPLPVFKQQYPQWEIVEYEVLSATVGDAWLMQQLGKGYDYLAVFGRLFRKNWESPDRWHCQELVEARFVAAGARRFRGSPNLITPNMGYMALGALKCQ